MTNSPSSVAARLNRDCHCVTLDRSRLAEALGAHGDPLHMGGLLETHPHLFADTAVYVAAHDLARMAAIVAAVERVVALPAWQAMATARHAPYANAACAARGVFFGYDFHLGGASPQLIEINTNAGGALLNVALRDAQIACCDEARGKPVDFAKAEELVEMFRQEWQLARGDVPLRTVAIVDDSPAEQYLLPEFQRFVQLFAAHGIEARILDPQDLQRDGDALVSNGWRISLVYNRVTDFLLEEPRHAVLADACNNDLAVVTPHPRAWALYADKRNLVTFTDADALRALGADEETIAVLLAGIPRTECLTPANADAFWATRKQWFFKPAAGYGSKAAYRGDKLTTGKWQDILGSAAGYVAQKIVAPGERNLLVNDTAAALKVDLRNYVYGGRVQLVSARLYQGQTTNFRTQGGGFAAVFSV